MKAKHSFGIFLGLVLFSGVLLVSHQWVGQMVEAGRAWTVSPEFTRSVDQSKKIIACLQVHPYNPRYFAEGTGGAVLLSGFEFWDVVRLDGQKNRNAISWSEFLNTAQTHGVNFIRLWRWNELTKFRSKRTDPWYTSKEIWTRTGPGIALDGKPKFDLKKPNRAYFDELRVRVMQAKERGFYVSVMLFEGWSLLNMEAPWRWDGHPMNCKNNVQGVNGDLNGDGIGLEVHSLYNPKVTYFQEQYVKQVIDAVNDLDNVLYEISNEDHSGSIAWQYHMINFIKTYELTKPKQHPIWISMLTNDIDADLFGSPAHCISPGTAGGWGSNPPAASGSKIILNDTDHCLAGGTGSASWVWKSFTRGLNIVNYMELDQLVDSNPRYVSARNATGHVLRYAKKMNLVEMIPRGDLTSTEYALANAGSEYLVYVPSFGHRAIRWFDKLKLHPWVGWLTRFLGWNESVKVDLSGTPRTYRVEWFNPRTGETVDGATTSGGGKRSFTCPFTGDALLHIYKP